MKNKNRVDVKNQTHDASVDNPTQGRNAGNKKDHESKGGQHHDSEDRLGKTPERKSEGPYVNAGEDQNDEMENRAEAEKPTPEMNQDGKGKIAEGKGGVGQDFQNRDQRNTIQGKSTGRGKGTK